MYCLLYRLSLGNISAHGLLFGRHNLSGKPAVRNIDDIDSGFFQSLSQLDAIIQSYATHYTLFRRQSPEQRIIFTHNLPDCLDALKGEGHPLRHAAAVFIAPLVIQRREKPVQQVGMGTVNIYKIQPGSFSTGRGSSKLANYYFNLSRLEFPGISRGRRGNQFSLRTAEPGRKMKAVP